jgi:hypothetical protein
MTRRRELEQSRIGGEGPASTGPPRCGVYEEQGEELRFLAAPPPTPDE